MARKPRIHYPGACYHVVLRGNAGQDIFFDKQDRSRLFFLLQEGIEKYKHRIHAYCLMTNHIHLAIQVGEIPLSRILQNVSFRYTRYINRRKKQMGHLFQGRYKALLIDVDSYLLELVRYMHNNPVRAGIVKEPEEYPWSSHVAYLGDVSVPWLSTDWVLAHFFRQEKLAIELYRQYVVAGKDNPHKKEFHCGSFQGRILGEDSFVEEALTRASQRVSARSTLEHMLAAVCAHYNIRLDDLTGRSRQRKISEARAVVALLVRESEHLSLMELSRRLNRDLSTLSQAASRLDKKIGSTERISQNVSNIKNVIT